MGANSQYINVIFRYLVPNCHQLLFNRTPHAWRRTGVVLYTDTWWAVPTIVANQI